MQRWDELQQEGLCLRASRLSSMVDQSRSDAILAPADTEHDGHAADAAGCWRIRRRNGAATSGEPIGQPGKTTVQRSRREEGLQASQMPLLPQDSWHRRRTKELLSDGSVERKEAAEHPTQSTGPRINLKLDSRKSWGKGQASLPTQHPGLTDDRSCELRVQQSSADIPGQSGQDLRFCT